MPSTWQDIYVLEGGDQTTLGLSKSVCVVHFSGGNKLKSAAVVGEGLGFGTLVAKNLTHHQNINIANFCYLKSNKYNGAIETENC